MGYDIPMIHRWEQGELPSWYFAATEPYWNGYVWYTVAHEDGECKYHRPERDAPD